MLPYVALCCLTLPYVAVSYLKVGLYCSKAGVRVLGGVGVVVGGANQVVFGVVLGLC